MKTETYNGVIDTFSFHLVVYMQHSCWLTWPLNSKVLCLNILDRAGQRHRHQSQHWWAVTAKLQGFRWFAMKLQPPGSYTVKLFWLWLVFFNQHFETHSSHFLLPHSLNSHPSSPLPLSLSRLPPQPLSFQFPPRARAGAVLKMARHHRRQQ